MLCALVLVCNTKPIPNLNRSIITQNGNDIAVDDPGFLLLDHSIVGTVFSNMNYTINNNTLTNITDVVDQLADNGGFSKTYAPTSYFQSLATSFVNIDVSLLANVYRSLQTRQFQINVIATANLTNLDHST